MIYSIQRADSLDLCAACGRVLHRDSTVCIITVDGHKPFAVCATAGCIAAGRTVAADPGLWGMVRLPAPPPAVPLRVRLLRALGLRVILSGAGASTNTSAHVRVLGFNVRVK